MSKVPENNTHRWLPLESNPEVFTTLAHSLGLSPSLSFIDVFSLDDDFISFIPRPVHALILVFPTGPDYDETVASSSATGLTPTDQSAANAPATNSDGSDGVIWFKQTIHNACGFYALLHASLNGPARSSLTPNSPFSHITRTYPSTPPQNQENLLLTPEIERQYQAVAKQGDSAVPALEAEVDFHFTCFVSQGGRLWELNGDLGGCVDLGNVGEGDGEDLLGTRAVEVVRWEMERRGKEAGGGGCGMLALVEGG